MYATDNLNFPKLDFSFFKLLDTTFTFGYFLWFLEYWCLKFLINIVSNISLGFSFSLKCINIASLTKTNNFGYLSKL